MAAGLYPSGDFEELRELSLLPVDEGLFVAYPGLCHVLCLEAAGNCGAETW